MVGDYILCGLRVRSALAMPELLQWNGDNRPPDVEISFDEIAEPSEPPIATRLFSKLWADGTYILTLENVGRFQVSDGNRILVNPTTGAQESELRLFVLGTSFGILCHQRGLYPLHASSVNIDGMAIILVGNTGMGKSTLAAALGERGHSMVSDDVTVFDPATESVLPAYPQRKLTPDVLDVLGLQAQGLESVRPGTTKLRIQASENFNPAPLKAACIYILEKGPLSELCSFSRLPSPLALAHLGPHIYRRPSGIHIQTERIFFDSAIRLLRNAPAFVLTRGMHSLLSDVAKFAENVELHIRSVKTQTAV